MPWPWPGRVSGRPAASCRVWKYSRPDGGFLPWFPERPEGSSRPLSISSLVAFAISSSRKRLTCRTFRADSERPFLPASSSSRTPIGRKMSCSSKRKIAAGSCIRTFVSSTNARRAPLAVRDLIMPASKRARRFEDLRRVAGDADPAPFIAHDAPGVDEESAAFDAHHFPAVHVLLLPDAELRRDRVVLVRAELERELHLFAEAAVRLEGVARDTEDRGAGAAEGRREIAEVRPLQRAAGRVVTGIEIDDQRAVA